MKELAFLDVTDRKRLVLSIGEYRGEERIDLIIVCTWKMGIVWKDTIL